MLIDNLNAKRAVAAALHSEVRERQFLNADDAAREFGLRPLGERWRSVDRQTASLVLFSLLIEDMAYSSPRLEKEQAIAAADEFLGKFNAGAMFFTNGNWEKRWQRAEAARSATGPSWDPATSATFDGGIIALDQSRSGILWLEDED
jgi:hypothetical protein